MQGRLLLASSGKEFTKPTGILSSTAEVKKARKEAMGRLGLDFLDTDDMDLEKEFAAEAELDDDVEMEEAAMSSEETPELSDTSKLAVKQEETPPPVTPSAPSPTASNAPSLPDRDVALSARERNRLKRKRKPGTSAFVSAPPTQSAGAKYAAAPAGPSNKYEF